MVRAYRIFYTTYNEDKHAKILEILREKLRKEPIVHVSMIKEFRYVEFKGDDLQPGLEREISESVKQVLGEEAYVRVDYINL